MKQPIVLALEQALTPIIQHNLPKYMRHPVSTRKNLHDALDIALITHYLTVTLGNQVQTARCLNLNRNTLRKLIRLYNINVSDYLKLANLPRQHHTFIDGHKAPPPTSPILPRLHYPR